jgi:hypothetical protein
MEHRWGARVAVDLAVRLTAPHPFVVRSGRLKNFSLSGALISTTYPFRVLSKIQVVLDSPLRPRHDAPVIVAHILRKLPDGIGVEWGEFSPAAINLLWRAVSAHPYAPIGRTELATGHKHPHGHWD